MKMLIILEEIVFCKSRKVPKEHPATAESILDE
jgi:hypothetical protein